MRYSATVCTEVKELPISFTAFPFGISRHSAGSSFCFIRTHSKKMGEGCKSFVIAWRTDGLTSMLIGNAVRTGSACFDLVVDRAGFEHVRAVSVV